MERSPSRFSMKPGCVVSMKAVAFCVMFLLMNAMLSTATHQHSHVTRQRNSIITNPSDISMLHVTSTSTTGDTDTNFRLPTSIIPIRYMLKLQPLINGNFSIIGYTEITIEVLEATTNITLHIVDIITKNETIKLNLVDDPTGPGVPITEHMYDPSQNFYIASLGEELVAGQQYVLTMEYEGYLNDQLKGFYRSKYTKEDGTETWLAVSFFSSIDARRAFPCFDEPALKAEFDVYIARQSHMTAISNMPRIETLPFEDDPDWMWDHFNTTLPMSTYLVAFIVSDFPFLNSTYNDHVLFRVWAREEALSQAEYATEAGPAILTWYEQYFDIPFPLPKQDMFALPDSSASGMENWGLITYSETSLLYNPVMSSAYNKERVGILVAHELAHQWFGDLVTMEWWTDIWLNEGFATYVEYLGTDFYEPTWNMLDQLVVSELQYVFGIDSLESSHPISMPIDQPEEINQLFDTIAYSKGASIIRMMKDFLTENTFRAGITNYLNTFAYSNAAQDDLWKVLTKQAHIDDNLPLYLTVKTIMDTWTLQMGYPVINIAINGDGTATLTQERFLMVKNPNSTDIHEYKWWVPITFTTEENPDFTQTKPVLWMSTMEVILPDIGSFPSKNSWIILNIQETGYYRVNYEPSNWQLLVNQLVDDHTIIHLVNRAQLIDDALNLARAGQLSYEIALTMNSYLEKETEFIPWSSALNSLSYLEVMFTRRGGYGQLKDYLLFLLTPLYDNVGFEDNLDDPHLEQKKRVIALAWACHLGLKDCVTNSVNLYSQWMAEPPNNTLISPNQKSTVYCTAIAEGSEEEWNFGWNQYLGANLATEQDALLSALGCSKEIWILSRYLEMAFTEGSGIRKEDSGRVFAAVAGNDIGRDLAWNYLQDNVDMIIASSFEIGDLVYSATYEFNTNAELRELEQFKEDNGDQLDSVSMIIDQSIERTRNNVDWMDSYYDIIVIWLQSNGFPLKFGILA